MHPIIKAAAQTALCFLALNGCVVLGAATAWAEVNAALTPRPLCEEGRAVLAGRLAYLEARLSPAPDQQQAWEAFKTAVRAAVEPLDALCAEGLAPVLRPILTGWKEWRSPRQRCRRCSPGSGRRLRESIRS